MLITAWKTKAIGFLMRVWVLNSFFSFFFSLSFWILFIFYIQQSFSFCADSSLDRLIFPVITTPTKGPKQRENPPLVAFKLIYNTLGLSRCPRHSLTHVIFSWRLFFRHRQQDWKLSWLWANLVISEYRLSQHFPLMAQIRKERLFIRLKGQGLLNHQSSGLWF